MATGRVPTTANSPLTAKGDLFGYSTTQARVAVGNDGETLVADSSTSTGLRYIPATVMSNPVINSCFDIWQRGTSISVTANPQYVADRWMIGRSATSTMTVSRQATGDTTNLPNVQYCGRFQRNAGDTSTAAPNFAQFMETVNSIPYAGKTVTLSFYARVGANWSAGSSFNCYFNSGTGTDQNSLTGAYTGVTSVATSNPTLTTTWVRYTLTGTVATTATELSFGFYWTPTGTAGANDYVDITGVQIDVGSIALPIRRNGATIQGELAACQRYYYRLNQSDGSGLAGQGIASTTTVARCLVQHPVMMRVAPTSMDFSTLYATDFTNYDLTVTAATAAIQGRFTSRVDVTVASGFTQYRQTFFGPNTGGGYIGFSAEL